MFACNRNCRIIYWNELTGCHNEDPFPNRKKLTRFGAIFCWHCTGAVAACMVTCGPRHGWKTHSKARWQPAKWCIGRHASLSIPLKWYHAYLLIDLSVPSVNDATSSLLWPFQMQSIVQCHVLCCVVMHSAYNYDDSSYGNISNWYLCMCFFLVALTANSECCVQKLAVSGSFLQIMAREQTLYASSRTFNPMKSIAVRVVNELNAPTVFTLFFLVWFDSFGSSESAQSLTIFITFKTNGVWPLKLN